MKRFFCVLILLWMSITAASAQGAQPPRTTVMIYMCGSNLESLNGSASQDIMEMLESGYDRERTNLVIMAGGAQDWQEIGVTADATSIFDVSQRSGELRQRWQDSLLNMGDGETLAFFLQYAAEHYPADRYALILWDHGGGPLGGVCWDELSSDHLTMEELTGALAASPFAEKGLEWIGFDACLMASAEIAWQVEPFARYMVASEETEPSYGWHYGFLNGLENDADGAQTGKRIISAYLDAADEGDRVTLSCVDLSQVDDFRKALDTYFAYLGASLDADTFSDRSNIRKASAGLGRSPVRAIADTVSGDYDLVDVGSLMAQSEEGNWMRDELREALASCVVANGSTVDSCYGLSLYYPLYNKVAYLEKWRDAYAQLNFSDAYTRYVKLFGEYLTQGSLVDWSGLTITQTSEEGSDSVRLRVQLSPEQLKNVASVRLVALGAGEHGTCFRTYMSGDLEIGEDGVVEADYAWETLHVVDDLDGHAMTPAIDFEVTDEGDFAVRATAQRSMSEGEEAVELILIYGCGDRGEALTLKTIYVYDRQTATFTNRISFRVEDYPYLLFQRTYRIEPQAGDRGMPGFDDWNVSDRLVQRYPISTKNAFHLAFIQDDSAGYVYACFEITDTQNNVYISNFASGGPELHNNVLQDNIVMGMKADAIMIDEQGVYLSLSLSNRYARIFSEEKNKLYFFAPQINGISCTFDDGVYTTCETEPESMNMKVLFFRWPEGVTIESARSIRFRVMTCYTDRLGELEGENPIDWNVSEYGELVWNAALLAGRESVSMSADNFEITCYPALAKLDFVPSYAEEAVASGIVREDPSDIVIDVPEVDQAYASVDVTLAWLLDWTDESSVLVPFWSAPFAADAERIQFPGGPLYVENGGEAHMLAVRCGWNALSGEIDGPVTFDLGGDGKISPFETSLLINLAYSCVDGMTETPAFPLGVTDRLTVTTPLIVVPKEDVDQGAIQLEKYTPDYMPAEFQPDALPMRLAVWSGYPEGTVAIFTYTREDGSCFTVAPVPLKEASRPADARLQPEAEWRAHWRSVGVNARGERRILYGDLGFSVENGGAVITDYQGTDEVLVIPEQMNGYDVTAVRLEQENPYVKELVLPKGIERVNMGSDYFPEYFVRCGFGQLPSLETVVVQDWQQDGKLLPFNSFFLVDSLGKKGYNSVKHVICGEYDVYFSDGFFYEPTEDGSVIILGVEQRGNPYLDDGALTIPAQLNGMPVKGIADGTLEHVYGIETLVLEEGIREIGARAFQTAAIKEVTLPSTIERIGEEAFNVDHVRAFHCMDPNQPVIGAYLAEGGVKLVGAGITSDTSIFRYELNADGGAVLLGFAEGVEYTEEKLIIPATVDGHPVYSIGKEAFRKLDSDVEEVWIEDGIEELGAGAFDDAFLRKIRLPETLRRIENGALDLFYISEIRIPASVTEIEEEAFGHAPAMRLIFSHVPEQMAFDGRGYDCIVCPDAIREELLSRFRGENPNRVVYSEEHLRQSENLTYALENGEAIIVDVSREATRVDIPAELDGCPVVCIAPYAFYEASVQRVTLPDGLRAVGTSAFEYCEALVKIDIPDSVTYLGENAFSSCDALTAVKLPAGVAELPSMILWGCENLKEVVIPEGVTRIGFAAFGSCRALEKLVLPESLKFIDEYGFDFCSSLTTVILPAGIETISDDAFEYCAKLEQFVLKGPVEGLESVAFAGDRKLVPYEEYVRKVEAEMKAKEEAAEEAATRCGEQIVWKLEEDGTLRLSGSGAMFDYSWHNDKAPWKSTRHQVRHLVIEEGIETIGDAAFYGCVQLETVSLPESLRSIGAHAFMECEALREITVPQGVVRVQSCAFSGDTALESITLPDGLEELGGFALQYCENLKTLRVPEGVTSLEHNLLEGCKGLTSIELPSSLRTIDEAAFLGCTGLTSIVIPDGVESIDQYAFCDCTNVTSIVIPGSVTHIGMDIFADEESRNYSFFSNSPTYQFLEIVGDEGSTAEEYARLYNIRFRVCEKDAR